MKQQPDIPTLSESASPLNTQRLLMRLCNYVDDIIIEKIYFVKQYKKWGS